MHPHATLTTVYDRLWSKYGPVMDAKALCEVLHYPTPRALRTAKARGKLPFTPLELRGRGLFASTAEIAALLEPAPKDQII